VSVGIFITNRSFSEQSAFGFSSSNKLTVYQAEKTAIWIARNLSAKMQGKVLILSDSKSAIDTIKKFKAPNNSSLTHVKAHIGIEGNEIADFIAKGFSKGSFSWPNFWHKFHHSLIMS